MGNVIEFWGFKRNQGRMWALLYLRGEPLTAGEIERELDLSKGGVSMLLRDLERWGVVMRVRPPSDTVWRYEAETDLVRMVTHVIAEREVGFVSRIRADLAEARRLAQNVGGVPAERLQRLEKMATLAAHVEKAIRLFIKTARLDVGGVLAAFRDEPGGGREKRR
ncbi:MarR family transcriptional regulator [Stigmatella sp. ncwal1]|uniref:HTH-type transcriptional regulator n=1 Tax=Stigmatella ashevillensis TaxID=2995309 RepID=A0ABT5CZP5_9BACT|nr:MarR family transcriptional regulator [Stigmatella ashevillena]